MSSILLFGGGLYGNRFALSSLRRLRDTLAKSFENVTVVLNGDFHWFDARPEIFRDITEQIQQAEFKCTLGNVEKQLMLDDDSCGCNYPKWVDSETPRLANLIYSQLLETSHQEPQSVSYLRILEEEIDFIIDDQIIRLVHGEPGNLNGWGLSRETVLHEAEAYDRSFIEQGWSAVGCTHTCLPYILRLEHTVIINNGALGMPNVRNNMTGFVGAITNDRKSKLPGTMASVLYKDLKYSILSLPEYDHDAFQKEFLSIWPPGSPAHESYWKRISNGTHLDQSDIKLTQLPNESPPSAKIVTMQCSQELETDRKAVHA